MEKRLILVLVSFFALILSVNAQNFTKGYILKKDGNRIDGWIAYRTDKLNATECLFKSELNNESEKFYPSDILEYHLTDARDGDKYYISKTVKIEKEDKTVFLDFLLQGVMNLYYYAGSSQKYYLLESDGEEILAITQNPEFVYQGADKGIYYGTDTKYKGFLKYQFKDYPEIAKMTDDTDFSHKSMIKLVKAYHDQTCESEEECVVFAGKGAQSSIKVKFSAYAGINYISSFEVAQMILVERDFTATKVTPVVGAQVNLYLPRLSNSVSFFADLSLSNLKGESKKVTNSSDNILSFSTLVASLKGGFRYTYPKGKIRPMVEGGATYTGLFNKDLDFENNLTGAKDVRENQLAKGYLGIYLGAGVDFKLAKENFIFCRVVFEKNWYSTGSSHQVDIIGVRAGYTF